MLAFVTLINSNNSDLDGHIPSSSSVTECWQDHKISTGKIMGKHVKMFSRN